MKGSNFGAFLLFNDFNSYLRPPKHSFMQAYFKSSIGRLRLIGILEGLSLILLVFIAVPLKYFYNQPEFVRVLGMCHGILFLLFVYAVFSVASEYNWKFREITWKLLLSSVIPFGTFYVDSKILKGISV
mgnify:FL=1